MAALNSIYAAQLLRLIGTPTCPQIVDIRTQDDFDADPFLIPGSVRATHTDLPALKARLGSGSIVIVCQKGLKLSQGAAAWLRIHEIACDYLEGGSFAWRDLADAPQLPVANSSVLGREDTLWVTRHRPKIDRIACPWLIRRFVDSKARFLFVAPSEVAAVAERFDAEPFDVDGARWSHSGTFCTFDALLDAFGLRTPALDRLAGVVRAADTNQHDLAPEAAGLLAISVGLSRQYKDDLAQFDAGLALYDALYRWARDGFDETHACPQGDAA